MNVSGFSLVQVANLEAQYSSLNNPVKNKFDLRMLEAALKSAGELDGISIQIWMYKCADFHLRAADYNRETPNRPR